MREKNKSRKIKVILFTCIVVIGVAIYFVISNNKNSTLVSNIKEDSKSFFVVRFTINIIGIIKIINFINNLLILSIKATFLLTLLISSVLAIDIEWILSLWLDKVPTYAVSFTLLLMADTLILSLNSGVSSIIFASGRIKRYQIVTNCLRLSAIIIAYFVLSEGAAPYYLLISYIITSIVVFFSNQLLLHKELNLDNMLIIRKAYLPSFAVVLSLVPAFYIINTENHVIKILLFFIYCLSSIMFLGLSQSERSLFYNLIKRKK